MPLSIFFFMIISFAKEVLKKKIKLWIFEESMNFFFTILVITFY